MKRWIVAPLWAVMVIPAGLPAAAETFTAEHFENKYEDQLRRVAETGARMYRLDQAAWVATDEVLSRDRRMMQDRRMRGYIVDESGGKTLVLFVGLVDDKPRAIHEVAVDEGKVVRGSYQKFREGRDLTDHQAGLYAALDTARTAFTKEKLLQCAENINIIVDRQEGDAPDRGGYRVYVLSATTKPDVTIAGGHHRIDLNEDADKVVGIHSFTNTCVNIPKQVGRKDADTVAGLLLTHLKTPYPEEIHVFLSLNYGLPFYVLTTENKVGWKVDGGKISAEILPHEVEEGSE